jgi:hypothetical protein
VRSLPAGYPQLAAYLNSDPDFAIYRRFGFLQSRLLIYRQYEIEVLQERLHQLDRDDDQKDQDPSVPDNPRLYSWRWDVKNPEGQSSPCERAKLMDEIERKLTKYSMV